MNENKTGGIGVRVQMGSQSCFFRLESDQTIGDLRRQLVSLAGEQVGQQQQEITVARRAVADDVKLKDLCKGEITIHMRNNASSSAEIVTSENTDPRRCVLM